MSWSRPLRTEESTEWVPYGLPILGSLCRDWPNWTVRHPNSSLVFLLPHIPSHPHLSLSPRHSSSSLTILTRSPPDGLPDQQLCLLSFSLLNSHTEPSKHSNLTELPCLKLFDNFPEPTGQSPSSQASLTNDLCLGPCSPAPSFGPLCTPGSCDWPRHSGLYHVSRLPMGLSWPGIPFFLLSARRKYQIPFSGLGCHLLLCASLLGEPFHSVEPHFAGTDLQECLYRTSHGLCHSLSQFPRQTVSCLRTRGQV